MILLDITIVTFILLLINKIWRVENNRKIVFSVILLVSISQLRQNVPGAIYLYHIDYFDRYSYVLSVYGVFVALLFGYVVFLSGREKEMRTSFKEFLGKRYKLSRQNRSSYMIASIVLLVVLTVFGLVLYGGLPPVFEAILGLVQGKASGFAAIGDAREEITKGHIFGGSYKGQGILRILMRYGWAFAFGLAYVCYVSVRSKGWLILSIVMLICAFIFISGDGTRGPFIQFLIFVFVMVSFLHKLRKQFILYGLGAVFAILIGLSLLSPKLAVYRGTNDFYKIAFQQITERIVLGNSVNDIHAMEEHDKGNVPFRYGALHLRDIAAAIPGQGGGVPFAYELYRMKNPHSPDTTYYTGTYFTKTFVDFGILGSLVIYFVLGYFLGLFQLKFYRFIKSPTQYVLAILLISLLGTTTEVGPIGLMASLVVILAVYYFIGFLKRFSF